MLKKWIRKNKSNLIFSMIMVLIVKIGGDLSRSYPAFGGEDVLLLGTIGYWVLDYLNERKESRYEQ